MIPRSRLSPAAIANVKNKRFKAQMADLLDTPLKRRSKLERNRLYSGLRAHMRRFATLQLSHRRIELRHLELQAALDKSREQLHEANADNSVLKAGAKHAHYVARHDALTSLPNSFSFRESLDANIAIDLGRHQPLAVVYMDLDDFKSINDTHGHAIGDAVLRVVGARLRRTLRAEDIVSRLGGDEFACLLSGFQSREHIHHLVQKLINNVVATERICSIDLAVRISVGIAVYPQHGVTSESLLHVADAAMYCAKRNRIGCAFANDVDTTDLEN